MSGQAARSDLGVCRDLWELGAEDTHNPASCPLLVGLPTVSEGSETPFSRL